MKHVLQLNAYPGEELLTPKSSAAYLEFNYYGVEISFDNAPPKTDLTYALLGDTLRVLASFMLKMKICEVQFTISRNEDPSWMVISNGAIVKDPFQGRRTTS